MCYNINIESWCQLEKEKVKLDEVLKFLFSTSNKVLVKLLNGIFNENFSVDEVELTVSNNEFVEDDLGILRGDMFFDILNKDYNKASYHIEFQTKNDNIAKQSAILFEDDEILGEDFHKILLAIQNLIEYLNRNYMNDENIENEVTKMTKTLYDPEVEKRGIEKGRGEGIEEGINLTKKVFKLASQGETIGNISKICKILEEKVKEILD